MCVVVSEMALKHSSYYTDSPKKAASFGNIHVSVEEGKLIWVVSGSRLLKLVRKAISTSAAFTTSVYDSGF